MTTLSRTAAADLLDDFAAGVEAGANVTASFVAANVSSGRGRYEGLLHLADQIQSGREEVWEWFEALMDSPVTHLIRAGAESGDLLAGVRGAAQMLRRQ